HSSRRHPAPPPHTYTLSLHDALPIYETEPVEVTIAVLGLIHARAVPRLQQPLPHVVLDRRHAHARVASQFGHSHRGLLSCSCALDRKSTRLNSSHVSISYAVFCLKKK